MMDSENNDQIEDNSVPRYFLNFNNDISTSNDTNSGFQNETASLINGEKSKKVSQQSRQRQKKGTGPCKKGKGKNCHVFTGKSKGGIKKKRIQKKGKTKQPLKRTLKKTSGRLDPSNFQSESVQDQTLFSSLTNLNAQRQSAHMYIENLYVQ